MKKTETKQNKVFKHQWLKIYRLYKKTEQKSFLINIKKKHVSRAVDRNRLKRWIRENLKKTKIQGSFVINILPQGKDFYKRIKRKEFDKTFNKTITKI